MKLSRRIYEHDKKVVKDILGIGDKELTDMIQRDHDEVTDKICSKLLFSNLNKVGNQLVVNQRALDTFDDVYFYKRCVHLLSGEREGIDITDGLNTMVLSETDSDIILDTLLNGKEICLKLYHRTYPAYIFGKPYHWTLAVYSELESSFSILFNADENVRKVYIDDLSSESLCEKCGGCKRVGSPTAYLRPRVRQNCQLEKEYANPLYLVGIMIDALETYIHKRTVKINKKERTATYTKKGRTQVARIDSDEDTLYSVSANKGSQVYNPSTPYVYKGGHHKSPVSHTRNGYFRKSSKGDHIIKDGQFVKVEKGMGNYTYVRSTIVNADKDSVAIRMI